MGQRCVEHQPTVLVVEDEPLIRIVATEALDGAGYCVLEAGDGDEALDVLASHNDVQLLFTDLNLPGSIDGLRLAEIVHQRWPHIRLLVTSGHRRLRDDQIPDAGHFVAKPYRLSTLVADVRQLIEGASK